MSSTEHGFEPKWTAGPWATDGINDEVIGCEPLHEVASTTAMCEGVSVRVAGAFDIDESVFPGIGSARANAELIALAPELAAAVLAMEGAILSHPHPDGPEDATDKLLAVAERLRMIGADDAGKCYCDTDDSSRCDGTCTRMIGADDD